MAAVRQMVAAVWVIVGVLCGAARAVAQQPAAERVAGTVVSVRDGRGIGRARVSLEDTRTNQVVAQTVAGAEGHFRFEPVAAGRYRLSGQARGFLQGAYLQHGPLSTALVTGQGLPTGNLQLQLTPGATLHGRVLDDAGEALEGATVTLYRQDAGTAETSHVVRARTARTGADGRFELRDVGEGRFYLAASGMPWYAVHTWAEPEGNSVPYRTAVDPALDVAYPMVFYPGVLRSEQAGTLTLQGGEDLELDFHMVPVPAVTLTLQHPPEGGLGVGRPQNFPRLTRSVFGLEEPAMTQGVVQNGSQQIVGLAPGEYSLQQFGNGNRAPVTLQKIDLTSGNVTLPMPTSPPLATVTVRLQAAPGFTLPAGLQLNLRDLEAGRRYASSRPDDGGVVSFTEVAGGDYRLNPFAAGKALTLAGVIAEGKPVEDRRLHVTGGQALQVSAVVSGPPVTVMGTATRGGRPVAGVIAILVPADGDSGEDLFRRDQSDLDGAVTFPNVSPGHYIVVAIEGGWNLPWTDPHILAKYLIHGVPVSIGPGEGMQCHMPEPVPVQPE